MTVTLKELLRLAIDLVLRKIRIALIDHEIRDQYRIADLFSREIKNATHGLADTHRRIVNLEARRRDL
jgi:hypothetical protein